MFEYKPLAEFNIEAPSGQRHMTKCPLCEQAGMLVVWRDQDNGYSTWNCTYCGEGGDNLTGWENKKSIEQGYVTFSDIFDEIDELYEKGIERGQSTGWVSLDKLYTVKKGEVTIVTGIPNHGKSTWLNSLLINLMDLHGWKVAAHAPEHMPHKMHASALLEAATGKPFWKSYAARMDYDIKGKGKAWLDERFVWITPKKRTLTDILSTASLLIRKKKCDILVIDPWNRLESSRPHGMTETEFVGQSMSRMSDFAKINNIKLFVVVHPHQMKAAKYEPGEMPKEPKPNAYSLSGSAHWNDMADNIISFWRDRTIEGNDLAEVHVLKVRWKMTGESGMDVLQFDKPTGRFFVNGRSELDKPPLRVKQ